MPKRFLVVWGIFAILASVHVSGCSLIGYGIGSAIDGSRSVRMRPGRVSQMFKVEKGARLMVRGTDGKVISGVYQGLAAEPDTDYVRRYSAWRDTARLPFRAPAIGEEIQIRGTDGRTMKSTNPRGVFLGFGPRRVHYRPADGKGATFVAFDKLRRIDTSEGPLGRSALVEASHQLPVQAIARIRRGRAERRVDLLDERVAGIAVGGPNRGFRTAGLIVGLAADATVFVIALAGPYQPYGSSCEPSYTGGFAGTIAPADSASLDSAYVLPGACIALAP